MPVARFGKLQLRVAWLPAHLEHTTTSASFPGFFLPAPLAGFWEGRPRFFGGALGSLDDLTVRTTGKLAADGASEAAFRIASAKTGVEATFSLSPLRDRDDMAVAAFCTRGAVHVSAPAEAPAGASFAVCRGAIVSQSADDPCGGHAISQGQDQQSLPNYPKGLPHALRNGMGLAYIASAFERCAYTAGCGELKELTMARQRLIQALAVNVLAQLAH